MRAEGGASMQFRPPARPFDGENLERSSILERVKGIESSPVFDP